MNDIQIYLGDSKLTPKNGKKPKPPDLFERRIESVEVTASFTGVIPTGEYENEKPLFSLKALCTGYSVEEAQELQQQLFDVCRAKFQEAQTRSNIRRLEKIRQDLRFYPPEQYPSVTSIIGWDDDFYISPDQLAQYGARGSIVHTQIEDYCRQLINGKEPVWHNPKDIPECYPDLVMLKKGSLGLKYDDVNFLGFLEKYPMQFLKLEQVVKNHQDKYAGRQDGKVIPEGKEWEKIGVKPEPTLIDYKTGSIDKRKCFKQLTAYWHCHENEDVRQAVIIPLTNKTQQGFSKPIVLNDKDKYWSLFLKDRKLFKDRFGI